MRSNSAEPPTFGLLRCLTRVHQECGELELLGVGGGGGGANTVDMTEAGSARTFSWSVGALSPHYTAAVGCASPPECH